MLTEGENEKKSAFCLKKIEKRQKMVKKCLLHKVKCYTKGVFFEKKGEKLFLEGEKWKKWFGNDKKKILEGRKTTSDGKSRKKMYK